MIAGIEATDKVLGSNENFLLGSWIADARKWSVLGSWGNTMRGAVRNKEKLNGAPYAYPRSWY